jgi:hypothetical protein
MRIQDIYQLFGECCRSKTKTKRFLCGQFIGSGCYRDVYIFKPDDRFVIKIERDQSRGNFANAMEWRNYINCREWPAMAKWLSPCEAISADGRIMLQRRVKRSVDGEGIKYPLKIPSLFTDTKRANWGLLNGKFVCCDYSFFSQCDFKMKKAKWW